MKFAVSNLPNLQPPNRPLDPSRAVLWAAVIGAFATIAASLLSRSDEPAPAQPPTKFLADGRPNAVSPPKPQSSPWADLPAIADRPNWNIFVRSCRNRNTHFVAVKVLNDINFSQIAQKDNAKLIDHPFIGFSSVNNIIWYDSSHIEVAKSLSIILTKATGESFIVSRGDSLQVFNDKVKKIGVHIVGRECPIN